MKKQFLKIAGVKSEQEFYNKYPTEEDFFKAHPEALKQLAGGGEAFPQIATANNFFNFGVGHHQLPMIMADGGSPYEELPTMGVENKLGRFVGELKNTAAAKINQNLSMYGKVKNPEQYDFEEGIPYDLSRGKYGGHLNMYQSKNTPGGINNTSTGVKLDFDASKLSPVPDVNSDKGTTNNYYYGQQNLPPEYNNNIDYLYGRPRPLSDFNIRGRGMAGNYRSTGWLKDEYGMDKLRNMGLTAMSESNPKWHQFFKRPTKTYYFGQQGQESMGSLPGQVDPQGMPVANQQGAGSNTTSGANQSDPGKGMGFFGRLFNREGNIVPQAGTSTSVVPNQQVQGPDMMSQRTKQMWNPEFTDWRNQNVQNRLGRIDEKLAGLETHKAWQQKQLGNDNIGLSGWRGRQERRLLERRGNLEDRMTNYQGYTPPQEFGGEQKKYQSNKTTGTVKTPDGRELPVNKHKFNEKTTFKPSMTVDEYLKMHADEAERQKILKQQAAEQEYFRNLPNVNSVEQYLKDTPPDTPWHKVNDVSVKPSVINDPNIVLPDVDLVLPDSLPGTTDTPLVMPARPSNSKRSFYKPGTDMFDGVEYIAPDSINFDSTNPQHRAAIMKAIIDGATDDSYDDLLPSMKNKKYGGSYNAGDVVDMTPEELERFIEMGGQVEFLD